MRGHTREPYTGTTLFRDNSWHSRVWQTQLKKGGRVKGNIRNQPHGSKATRQRESQGWRNCSSWRKRKAGSWGTQNGRGGKTDIHMHLTRHRVPRAPKAHTFKMHTLFFATRMGDAGATRHTIARLRVHLAQKLESSTSQPPTHRECCPHNQSPMPLATISGRPGCGSLAASGGRHTHTHPRKSPGQPQRFVIFSRSRVPKKKRESEKKKTTKGVGDGTIGRKGGLSAVLRVSRSTTSLKGRPLRKRPFLLPRASQGRGLGPGLSLGGGKGGRIKGAHHNNRPAGLAATRRTKQRPSQCVRVCISACVCVCVTRTCLCQAPQARARGKGESEEKRHTC